ncbi:MAG: hypothetical protein LBR33_11125, partial [Propionibacteriaceae bacterium]|jgi:hypothetical protein|nr:hypothetical protein [Propionibacteriaceae bacterium]
VLALRPWEEGPGAAVAADLVTAGLGPDEARAAATGVLYLVLGYAFDEDQRAHAQALGVAAGPGPDSAVILDQAVALVTAGLRVTAPPD